MGGGSGEFGEDEVGACVFESLLEEFGEDSAGVGGGFEVDALEELIDGESGPGAMDLASVDASAEKEHDSGGAVVGASGAVFSELSSELGDDDDGPAQVSGGRHVGVEGGEVGGELVEEVGEGAVEGAL